MTRAEEAASIGAYGWQADEDGNLSIEMFPETFKRAFIKGYEQAEKDTIERAIAWLKANAVNYIYNYTDSYPDAPFRATISGKCWKDLKKAMEDE